MILLDIDELLDPEQLDLCSSYPKPRAEAKDTQPK
jgi:hypothetical protein